MASYVFSLQLYGIFNYSITIAICGRCYGAVQEIDVSIVVCVVDSRKYSFSGIWCLIHSESKLILF
jgi:hypothetical protein